MDITVRQDFEKKTLEIRNNKPDEH